MAEAVLYLQNRFDGVVRVEEGLEPGTQEEGFGEFKPSSGEEALAASAETESAGH